MGELLGSREFGGQPRVVTSQQYSSGEGKEKQNGEHYRLRFRVNALAFSRYRYPTDLQMCYKAAMHTAAL